MQITETMEQAVSLEVAPFVGMWLNTNPASRSIGCIELAPVNGSLAVRVVGVGPAAPHDWGTAPATVYALSQYERTAHAFRAEFDLGYAKVVLQANIKGGVLVVATFSQIKDGSPRSSYFLREFYYRAET